MSRKGHSGPSQGPLESRAQYVKRRMAEAVRAENPGMTFKEAVGLESRRFQRTLVKLFTPRY